MKRLIINMLVLIFMISVSWSVAQTKGPQITFATESHDFGKVKEEDGPVSFKFDFSNLGGTPLVLSNVSASCGCTTPNWPKEPILPGAKNSIQVSYNPANRPGRFEKQITVVSNAEPATIVLKISGEVIPKQPTVEDLFPVEVEGLRFKSTQIAINNIAPDATITLPNEVYNNTAAPLKVAFSNVPKHIKIKITPEVVQPKSKAILEVTYDAKAKADWGFVFDSFDMLINDKTSANSRITVTANIQEDFAKLTQEQKDNAPKIEFENTTFDFDTAKLGDKVKHDYVFKNIGKTDLVIRKVAPSCGCTAINSSSSVVKAGEKGTISIEFNTAGRAGAQSKTITVISNDPANSRTILWIKGNVK